MSEEMDPDAALAADESMLYYGAFCVTLVGLLVLLRRHVQKEAGSHNASDVIPSPEFKGFQKNYLIVFLLVMGADWLQGPYVYALYSHYGFGMSAIARLFILGFGASLIFGMAVGPLADMYGRKKMCLAFGVLYALSCVTKHYNSYAVLMLGRLLGGISTSILFSSFESWMVAEHHSAGYPDSLLSDTFSKGTSGNGLVAIVSGICAYGAASLWGPVAPFDLSLVALVAAAVIVAYTWTENKGENRVDVQSTLQEAFACLRQDPKIVWLGIVQASFEGGMYVFVFFWTPALESTSSSEVAHGLVFASFMISVLIGSTLFSWKVRETSEEQLALKLFTVGAAALFIPCIVELHTVRLLCFFVFEGCVGMFWPCIGIMRSRYVPEGVRATVMNIFRVPLNGLVILTLLYVHDMPQYLVFLMCTAALTVAWFAQRQLVQRIGLEESYEMLGQDDVTEEGDAV